MAKSAFIREHVKRGFKLDENGRLTKGERKTKVEILPHSPMPGKMPGASDFNPRTDAFAVRMGGVFVSPNRYRLGLNYIDREGAMLDPDACPECGSYNGEYRWRVQVDPTRQPKNLKPWEHAYTYCKRCVTAEELAEVRALQAELAATAAKKGQDVRRLSR